MYVCMYVEIDMLSQMVFVCERRLWLRRGREKKRERCGGGGGSGGGGKTGGET